MNQVVFHRFAEDKHIIEEDDDELTQEGLKKLIHSCLKYRGRVVEPEGNYPKLIVSLMRSKCSLVNVLFLHQDLVVTLHQVQLRKPPCAAELIQQLIYGWYREPVSYCYGVKGPVIYAKPLRPVLLLHEQY